MHASAVSRLLATEFTRSESHTTRIRGWHNTFEGFEVIDLRTPFEVRQNKPRIAVKVTHIWGDFSRSRATSEMMLTELSAYKKLLETKYSVELVQDVYSMWLVVTDKPVVKKGRPLGKNQEHLLKTLRERNGVWHPHCGWISTNQSGTVRLLESLVKRGLVVKTEGTYARTGRTYPIYTAVREA